MTDLPPPSMHERLIETVPIMLGRIDAEGCVQEIEGDMPNEEALGSIAAGETSLFDVFPDYEPEIRAALKGRQKRFTIHFAEDGNAYFEVQLLFDIQRKSGAYFLIHDVTEIRRLQISLLECTDREQRRIGQDLHDTIGQELTGIRFLIETVRKDAGPDFDGRLREVQDRLGEATHSARRIAWQLSPQLEGEHIVQAFERLAEYLRGTFSVECELSCEVDAPITSSDVAFHLYRIAQEACTNAVKHAEARKLRIRLATGARNVLEVEDDGCGIDVEEITEDPGMGLSNMRFRANAIGGAIRISRPESGGTLVTCRFANEACDTSANGSCDECSLDHDP